MRLVDGEGNSAGNIDLVLAAYNARGKIVDFGSLEIQAVYISGNVRQPFAFYMEDRSGRSEMDWRSLASYFPRPDFLSSSRKRLVPQMLYKGGIIRAWGKKQAVAVQRQFFSTLPSLPEVDRELADIAWLLFDLEWRDGQFELVLSQQVYTAFEPALTAMTVPQPGPIEDFIAKLQNKLDEKQDGYPPDAPLLTDFLLT